MHYRRVFFLPLNHQGSPSPHCLKPKRGTSQDTGKSLTRVPSTLKNKHSFTLGETKDGGLKKGGCIRSELFRYWCSKGVGFSEEELFVFPHKMPPLLPIYSLTGPALEGVKQLLSREKKIHQEPEDDYSHSPMVGWQAKPEAGWSWVSEFQLYWTYFFLFIQQWTRQELSDY